MDQTLGVVLGTAATVGLLHTLIGVDHTLPFIVLARAQRWTWRRLMAITTLCGLGHVAGSVVLGFAGIGLGVSLAHLEVIESRRGELASWLLIGFGLAYAAWGLYARLRARRHSHPHNHPDGLVHEHPHTHHGHHAHPHGLERGALTAWTLFLVFVFGPCEPLIPLLMVPAMKSDWPGVFLVVAVFGAATLATMLVTVTLGYLGLQPRLFRALEEYVHVAAGATIALAGVAVKVLGI